MRNSTQKLPLPKQCLLTKPWQYEHVYAQGKRLRGNGFSLIFFKNSENQNRLGVSVSGMKLAVKRNRIKRLLKEFYRHNRSFPSRVAGIKADSYGVDLVIATNKKFQPRTISEVYTVFDSITKT